MKILQAPRLHGVATLGALKGARLWFRVALIDTSCQRMSSGFVALQIGKYRVSNAVRALSIE